MSEIFNYILEQPVRGAAGTAVAGVGIVGILRMMPVMVGWMIGQCFRGLQGGACRMYETATRAAGRKRAVPQTSKEFDNYMPKTGDTWIINGSNRRVLDVVKDGKVRQVRSASESGAIFSEELSSFRNTVRQARAIV